MLEFCFGACFTFAVLAIIGACMSAKKADELTTRQTVAKRRVK